jgi:hypothetical protein
MRRARLGIEQFKPRAAGEPGQIQLFACSAGLAIASFAGGVSAFRACLCSSEWRVLLRVNDPLTP